MKQTLVLLVLQRQRFEVWPKGGSIPRPATSLTKKRDTMEKKPIKPTAQEQNSLRNTIGNAYASLDSYIKAGDASIEQIQLMVCRLAVMIQNEALAMKGGGDGE